jgi:hypothetical protein
VGIGLYIVASIVLPVLFVDVYPFSAAPMFRDRPLIYCDYRIFAPDGRDIPSAGFQLQREYDGNPAAIGVGRKPAPSLNVYGAVATEIAVRSHVEDLLATMPGFPYVDVVQDVIGPVDSQRVGLLATNRWRVHRGR